MMKTFLVLGVLLALVLYFGLEWNPEEPPAVGVVQGPRGPSFAVTVTKSRLDRPFLGLVPEAWLQRMSPSPGELRFDHTSAGAIGSVGPARLELRADGWDLLLELDREGRAGPATRLVLPIDRAGRPRPLRCRPARRTDADLRITPADVPGAFDGTFRFQLAACEVAATATAIDWPAAPLTVTGSFTALPATATDRRTR